MLRPYLGLFAAVALAAFAAGCGAAPLPPPVVVPFESKMSWIVRLEDQRMLRDPEPPAAPAPPPAGRRSVVTPPPPPPPDLVRLLSDDEARVRRRAAAAVGRVGLVEGVAPLSKLLQGDT